jgi:hypothetical protein
MIGSSEFPRLTPDNHRITSPATPDYNCVAWATGDTEHWWQPGRYWHPANWPENDFGLGALEQAFLALRYVSCGMDGSPEDGFIEVALYGSGFCYTHAARQLPSGKWTSKLGKGEDIEHDSPDDVAGGLYGEVMGIMKRSITPSAQA